MQCTGQGRRGKADVGVGVEVGNLPLHPR
jgi:hypothetical protein